MRYAFEWDPPKATENLRKHGVSFEQAATIFRDPAALSIFDLEHSQEEDRWMTMGLDRAGRVLVLSHTFRELETTSCRIRMLSARKATKAERHQYQEGHP